MPNTFATRVGLHLAAPIVGAVVALSLRGEWNALLLVAFASAIAIASFSMVVLATDPLLQFLLALGFYAVAFQGLLGPLDGAFGGVWFILTIVFSSFQVGCVFLCSVLVHSQALRVALFPFAVVSFEFLRHHATKLYDGAGLTFCLLGQASASDTSLLQSANLGGIWLLSFYCSLLGAAIPAWFCPAVSYQFRKRYTIFAVCLFAIGYTYGRVDIAGRDESPADDTVLAYVVSHRPDLGQLESISESIRHRNRQSEVRETFVVYPETCMTWNTDASNEVREAILLLSEIGDVNVVLGVWIPFDSDSSRNVSMIAKSGRVVATVDKLHCAPFVESQPFGTSALVSAGLIPRAAIRNIAEAEPLDFAASNDQGSKIAQSVCYDIFFSESYCRFPANRIGLNVCCLDETFDSNGVFQKLSRVHSRVRAVETRQPVIRSSLGGFSGAYNSSGVPLQPNELNEYFAVYEVTPDSSETIYERWGDWFPICCVGICLGAIYIDRIWLRVEEPNG